ncbi:fatty acid-binding protein, adipocyte-like isoform X2 [Styela clava]
MCTTKRTVGVNIALRKMGNLAKPTLTLNVTDGTFYYKSESTFRTLTLECKIGEEFDETTPDGRKVKTTFSWEGDKLLHVQKWDGKSTKIYRYMDDSGDLINDCEMNAVTCKRIYTKA